MNSPIAREMALHNYLDEYWNGPNSAPKGTLLCPTSKHWFRSRVGSQL